MSLLLTFMCAAAATPCQFYVPPPPFETYLLPVVPTATPGALGTQWTSEFWIYNAGSRPLSWSYALPADLFPFHEPACRGCVPEPINPGEARRAESTLLRPDPPNEGRFIHIAKDVASSISMSLHVRDLSRQADDWGVEIPIVPLREMKTAPFQLLNVPLQPGFRVRLRVYGEDNPPSRPRVRVKIYRMNDAELLVDRELQMTYARTTPEVGLLCTWVPIVPIEAIIPDLTALVPHPMNARVEIDPLTTTNGYWAMITVTNNETQHVTLITPQ